MQQVKINSSEFQPKNQYILIKVAEPEKEKKSAGGIIIPMGSPTIHDRQTSGFVISVGKDIDDIVENDFVLWPGTDGLDIEFIDGNFMLLRYESIIGKKK